MYQENKLISKTFYEFLPESIIDITCVYTGHEFFNVIMKLKNLPERFLCTNLNGTHKIKSEVWTDSVLMSSIQSQFCIRIKGFHPDKDFIDFIKVSTKKVSSKQKLHNFLMLELLQMEFKSKFKKNGPSFQWNRYDIEEIMASNVHQAIGVMEKKLSELPFTILKDYQLDSQLLQNDAICKHLSFIYQKVVIPFNSFIRSILLENNLVSEGDLFNSTCEFSSLTFRRDDAIQIRQSLSMLFDKVKEEFNQVIKDYCLLSEGLALTISPDSNKNLDFLNLKSLDL